MFDPYGEYRDFIPGSYARLRDKMTKDVIMSDTPMERKTNLDLYRNASGRVLIGGLGIGMVLLAIQDKTEVTSITVIEKFKSIIDMVAPMLPLNGKVTIINDNVFTWLPKRGEKFDTIYMDIWNEISGELWAEHKELRKKFRKYLAQGGWLETWRSKDFQRKSYGR
jgi:spermidine synthase